jgi:hypothetical protein
MSFLKHNPSCRPSWLPLLSAFLLNALPLVAQEVKVLGEAASDWPGVVYQVTQIQRVNGTHLLVTVRLSVGASAENPTFVGVPPATGWKNRADLTPEELGTGRYDPTPLSLAEAVLMDQTTKATYKALPSLPATPFVGPNAVMTTLRPGNWLQMAVQFPSPPPPSPAPDGKVPVQRATILLPQANSPIKDILLPPPRDQKPEPSGKAGGVPLGATGISIASERGLGGEGSRSILANVKRSGFREGRTSFPTIERTCAESSGQAGETCE